MRVSGKSALLFLLLIIALSFPADISHAEEDVDRPKIGLALSGGGAKGLAHIGVLKVLEEVGVPIDFIAGTSMGSIIGALYSIGYTVEEIEQIADQDWVFMLSDAMPLNDISMEEKEESSLFIGSIPVIDNKLQLPSGLINGYNIQLMLSRLCWPVYNVDNFADFPIPFRCVAANIETGDAVVLRSGFLPDALRASMSIPSVFTPVEIDGTLLIDGGVARNIPVEDCFDMGADIVIAVDVGELLKTRDKLDSVVDIFEQTLNYRISPRAQEQRELADLVIRPDVSAYDTMSFDKAVDIIKTGEIAAQNSIEHLKILASRGNEGPVRLHPQPRAVYIKKIDVKGLDNVSRGLVGAKLALHDDSWMKPEDIEKAISRLYGSRYFESVKYRLHAEKGGTRLIIDVKEANSEYFRFGLRYGSDLKTAIILNSMFRNKIFEGSKLSTSTIIGESSAFKASYFTYIRRDPGLGMSLDWHSGDLLAPRYDNDEHTANYKYEYFLTELNVMTVDSNTASFKAGAHYGYARLEKLLGVEYPGAKRMGYMGFHASFSVNTYDHSYFPRTGKKFCVEVLSMTPVFISSKKDVFDEPCEQFRYEASRVDPIGNKFAIKRNLYLGLVRGDNIHPAFYYYLGGYNRRHTELIPFDGVNYLQVAGKAVAAGEICLRYEMVNKQYLSFRVSAGNFGDEIKDLYEDQSLFYGLGFSYAIDSMIGPAQFSLTWSSRENARYTHLNIGYWF